MPDSARQEKSGSRLDAGERLDIGAALAGQRLFVTGATGFLGKVLVEKLLWAVPQVGELLLLIRPSAGRSAVDRLREELFGSPLFARLRARAYAEQGEAWLGWLESRVRAIPGDLTEERFGLDPRAYGELRRQVDRVVACAATVRFDERLDRALATNVQGALRALELARDAGGVPLLQVSTCFVSGKRRGDVAEELPELGSEAGGVDEPEDLLATLEAARDLVVDSPAHGLDERALVRAGGELARRHGFHDVYTLTKALAERLLADRRGAVPLAIVRPAIVESAAAEPIPGWIEAVRVADPPLVAWGRGRTRTFAGRPDSRLDLVPVDHVIHATLAALAAQRRDDPQLAIYQVTSSRHPITLGELVEWAGEGFARTPMRDPEGRPIRPGTPRFVEPERYRRSIAERRQRLAGEEGRRGGERRLLDHLAHLLDVYQPYLDSGVAEGGVRYGDAAVRALWGRLSPAERRRFPFDPTALDWRSYVRDVHVPGVVRFALREEGGAPPIEAPEAVAARAGNLRAAEERANEATTLYELFAATAAAHPDRIAFQTHRQGRWLRYRYSEALAAVGNLARTLSERYGIGRGDRVALWASGSPEWVLLTLAAHRLGAATVPLDPQWPTDEVARAARFADAELVAAAPPLYGSAREALAEAACPVVRLAAPFVPEPDVGPLPGGPPPEPTGDEGDLASIVFTSGTTAAAEGALPKAVPLTHGNFLANVRQLVPLMDLSRERMLSVLPIHHVFELTVGLLVPLAGGSTVSYVAELKPAEIGWMMKTTRPTVLVAVPRLLELLHNGIRASVEAGGRPLRVLFRVLFALSRATAGRLGHRLFAKVHRRFGGSLRRIVTGGSALDPGLARRFEWMGFRVAEGYGMTETAPVLTVNPWNATRLGSAGRPLPGVEVDLRPPAAGAAGLEEALEPGAGEVWVRGANVTSGYFRNPVATAAVLADGWLNTGDLGRFDADGYLHLTGRTKDVIVTAAGKNVYPEEVETRYRDLPGVEELVVVGLPAAGAGEQVAAVVVPSPAATEAAIRAAVAERSRDLPSYQRIQRLEMWRGALPKTTTLKVKRTLLRRSVLAGEPGGAAPSGASAQVPAPEAKRALGDSERWMVDTLARLTRSRADLLRPETRFAELGIDSLTRVELVGEIESRFGVRLDDARAGALDQVSDLFELV